MKNTEDTNKSYDADYPKYLYVRYYDQAVLRLEKVWRENGDIVYYMDFDFGCYDYTESKCDYVNLSKKENENVINILHQNNKEGVKALFDSGESDFVYLTPNAAFSEI
jgi:hypothetical protein